MFSCSAELHIVHRVILRNFGESHGRAVVRLDVPNCLQSFQRLLLSLHFFFLQFKAECVSMCPKSLSVCLITARGCSSVQATSPFKHTFNPLCERTRHYSKCVC